MPTFLLISGDPFHLNKGSEGFDYIKPKFIIRMLTKVRFYKSRSSKWLVVIPVGKKLN